MRIGIDARFLSKVSQGTGTYTKQLVTNLIDTISNEDDIFLLSKDFVDEDFKGVKGLYNAKLVSDFTPFNCLWGYSKIAKEYKLDIVHSNYLNSVTKSSAALLITIHDILFKTHKEYFPSKLRLGVDLLSNLSLSKADRVITVSNYSKNKIVEFYPFLEGRVDVIYEAANEQFSEIKEKEELFQKLKNKFSISKPYLLFVGRFAAIKNLEILIEFFQDNKRIRQDFDLVLVGSFDPSFPNSDLRNKLLNDKDIHVLGNVSTGELNLLYNGARLFYFVSHGEGFGLPILEAMSAGCPVLTSNTTSCDEIAGEAAIKVNPTCKEEIFNSLDNMLYNDELLLRLSEKGVEHSNLFSWRQCAIDTYNIYKSLK